MRRRWFLGGLLFLSSCAAPQRLEVVIPMGDGAGFDELAGLADDLNDQVSAAGAGELTGTLAAKGEFRMVFETSDAGRLAEALIDPLKAQALPAGAYMARNGDDREKRIPIT